MKSKIVASSRVMDYLKRISDSVTNTGDSVKEVREIRKKLSKGKIDLKKLNSY